MPMTMQLIKCVTHYSVEKDCMVLTVMFTDCNGEEKFIAMNLANTSLDEFVRNLKPLCAKLEDIVRLTNNL